ncbi:Ubiquitin carboxyl-terminal hydrolase 14 [Geodia barretti]|uniref:Ubiquitin carboxyl-terminal hydrolase 14 n=1 Tax=Geodia barretti TaxID=519541 RepID=A0AA35TGL4_GEOBA|nr:Ubiquitin carboxyl-terminal hydrolase 14 [Geodia barretti]
MDTDTASPQSLTKRPEDAVSDEESGQDIRIPSMLFLHTLHAVKPEFAHKDREDRILQQQDAHSSVGRPWSITYLRPLRVPGILLLRQPIREATGGRMLYASSDSWVETKSTSKMRGVVQTNRSTTETDTSYQVSCFIARCDQYMYTAMRKGNGGDGEVRVCSSGRDADFTKTSPLSRLPGYLTVQFWSGSSWAWPPTVGEMVARKILKVHNMLV